MASTFDDTILDFDLNFLQQPPTVLNDCKYDKQRKSVLIAKKKTIATDSLIRKYYAKNEKLEQTEVLLLAAKEECKQVCIDYKDTLEKCTRAEKDALLFKSKIKELEDSNSLLHSQCEAMKSHANQLQVLVNDHVTVVEALKIENQLNKGNNKEHDNKLSNLQKENAILLNNLCLVRDIVFGKRKLKKHHKLLLKKYDKHNYKSDGEESSEESNEDNLFFDSLPPSPMSVTDVAVNKKEFQITLNLNNNSNTVNKVTEDHESDCSNEVISEDTGRGSSLAFSDVDKCYNSPDYFHNDSPLARDASKPKEKRVFIDICTNTINPVSTHVSTSPILFDDVCVLSNDEDVENVKLRETMHSDLDVIKEKKELVDNSTSPIKELESLSLTLGPICRETEIVDSVHNALPLCVKDVELISPLTCKEIELNGSCDVNAGDEAQDVVNNNVCDEVDRTKGVLSNTNAPKVVDNIVKIVEPKQINIENLSSQCEIEITNNCKSSPSDEKRFLERHNSDIVCDETSDDFEIEMILNTMRFTEKLITPIPKTPVKLNNKITRRLFSTSELDELEPINGHIACKEALLLREENKVLKTSISDLSKEVMKIKRVLRKRKIMSDSPTKVVNDKNKMIMYNLFDNSSQKLQGLSVNSAVKNSKDVDVDLPHCHSVLNSLTKSSMGLNTTAKTNMQQNIINVKRTPTKMNTEYIENKALAEYTSTPDTAGMITDKAYYSHTPVNTSTLDNKEENIVVNSDKETVQNDHGQEFSDIVYKKKTKRKLKRSKVSRLERFRKKLIPKSKIAMANAQMRKQPKSRLISALNDKHLLDTNKLAYQKAVNVMKQLKLKDYKKDQANNLQTKNSDQTESSNNTSKHNEDSVTRALVKQPVVCLSQLNLDDLITKTNEQEECDPEPIRYVVEIVDSPPKNYPSSKSHRKVNERDSITTNRKSSTEYIFKGPDRSPVQQTPPRKRQMNSERSPDMACKRILRSSNMREMLSSPEVRKLPEKRKSTDNEFSPTKSQQNFNKQYGIEEQLQNVQRDDNSSMNNIEQSVLCRMIDKYGKANIKYSAKKVPDNVTNSIFKKLEDSIAHIIELPAEKAKPAMAKLVEDIQHNWKLKNFLSGFLKYLKDNGRKTELFNKVNSPPAPPMTKSEQVVLFIVKQLSASQPDVVNIILTHIEFSLFQLNKTPEFDVIESLSHMYALICRYFGLKMRLRLFILDAMYCLSFKVVPLIKQCLDVWMHILPLAHMGVAKSPLVTCLVYLLHFYKCEDRYNRVQDIRDILNRKYFFKITDWNEPKMLELFRTSILELRDIAIEKKMLRIALILLAKRQGAVWCQKNIVKKMLVPIIEKEDTPLLVKQFCIEVLGPLLKPYAVDMRVHCEIVFNNLLDMLDQNPSDSLYESILTSLIYMSKHNQNRVLQALLLWKPTQITPEFEQLMKDYVRERSLKVWKGILSKITF